MQYALEHPLNVGAEIPQTPQQTLIDFAEFCDVVVFLTDGCGQSEKKPRNASRVRGQREGAENRYFSNKLGNHSDKPGQYVTTIRNDSMVSSQGQTAWVSSVMPILVMPEATYRFRPTGG